MSDTWNGYRVLARGLNRLVVADPDDPEACLKFENGGDPRSGGHNAVELAAHAWLATRLADHDWPWFARCRGPLRTPHGKALQCARVRHADGRDAVDLQTCLAARRYDADTLCAAAERLQAVVLRNRLPLFDVNLMNLVPREDASGGVELVCVDVKSLVQRKEALPLSHWIAPLRARKVRRRFARLRRRIREALQPG
ncbi:YrbL family protein [Coralloluteibacterium stylophorae]|uniref:PhoP regulatory network protein YrbL n=1 Tax=Coralloluteibacterium stylophorae TaxID=1776034 RepID=A0AAP2C7J4_9GAMM|nr:YrbL family protein [Coralloluteibacterium stylophorae]MBS7455863.1 hypothetical protein [Coralloluteibacterium stylophorae]